MCLPADVPRPEPLRAPRHAEGRLQRAGWIIGVSVGETPTCRWRTTEHPNRSYKPNTRSPVTRRSN